MKGGEKVKLKYLKVIDEERNELNINDLTFEGLHLIKMDCIKLLNYLNHKLK